MKETHGAGKKEKRRSIAMELSLLFIGLLLLIMIAMVFLNNVYLSRFYELRLQRTLQIAYRQVDEHVSAENGVDKDFFENEFRSVERTGNIALVISDPEFSPVLEVKREDDDIMAARLNAYSMGLDQDDVTIIEQKEDYIIQKKSDDRYRVDFLEMWGTLPSSSYHFMMRIPMDSIRMNVKISNEFILYTILITGIAGIIMIGWLSRRIAKPVKELTQISARMANLDFNARYTSGGKNEIGQLGENFNRMSETLEKAISELKTANNELQKNLDEKIKIDDMRREFLGNVSHELKTPLALIQGYAEGLQDSVADDPESRNYYCEVIVDEAAKMNMLVQKLLTLNQLEFGEEKLEMTRFDICELIRGKVNSSRILADQKGASLTYEGPSRLEVWGDEFKVEEVLTNYLSNAINHVDDSDTGHIGSHRPSSPDAGAAGIHAGHDNERRIVVSAAVRGKTSSDERWSAKVRVSVFNTGSHIPEEDLRQVWDKFFKVDKARTREYGGSGVGLSIVRAIMDSFHQDYGVRNTEDGVEFWFELDYAGSATEASGEGAQGAADKAEGAQGQTRRRDESEKEALKRMKRELQSKDEPVDAEWVSASDDGRKF